MFNIPENSNLVIGFGRYMTGATMISCDAIGTESVCTKYYCTGHVKPDVSEHLNQESFIY
jgi:hypothetical protein